MNINQWYKNIVDSGTEVPPETVWESIQDELDVDAVWTRLDTSLSSHARKKRFAAFAVAATLFLAVSTLGLWYILSPGSLHDPKQAAQLEQEQERIAGDTLSAIAELDEVTTDDTGVFSLPTPVEKDLRAAENLILAQIASTDEIQPGQATKIAFKMPVTPFEPLPVLLADLQIQKKQFEIFGFSPSSVGTGDFASYTGDAVWAGGIHSSTYFGLTGQLANTWMLNSKTFSGLKSDELTFTDPSFGSNIGLQIGTGLTQRFGVRAEFLWLSRNRQTYREYISGNFVTNDIILDYYTLKLLARYNAGSNARPHFLLAGAYTGFMQQATQVIDGISNYVDNEYENLDFGIILGYEYPVALTRHLTFTPGIFGKMGLNNIFSGNESIPFYLNQTRNASVNLSFAITYSFY
jgi:hypothetical protein